MPCHYPALPCNVFFLPMPACSRSPASDPPLLRTAEMRCSLPSLKPTVEPVDFLRGRSWLAAAYRLPNLMRSNAVEVLHARLTEYPRSTSFPPYVSSIF